jgi:hypothetical protein
VIGVVEVMTALYIVRVVRRAAPAISIQIVTQFARVRHITVVGETSRALLGGVVKSEQLLPVLAIEAQKLPMLLVGCRNSQTNFNHGAFVYLLKPKVVSLLQSNS